MTFRCLTILWGLGFPVAAMGGVGIYPQPRQVSLSGAVLVLPDRPIIVYTDSALKPCADLAAGQFNRYAGRSVTLGGQGNGTIVLSMNTGLGHSNGYTLTITSTGATITGQSVQGVFFGVQSLGWLMRAAGERRGPGQALTLPGLTIQDWPDVQARGMTLQWCFTIPSKDVVYDTAAALAALKYNAIEPEFGPNLISYAQWQLFPAYSWITQGEFRDYATYCRSAGLEVVPYLNCLGHVERGMPWPTRLGNGLDMGDERNYTALFDVLGEYLEDCPGTRYFHFGMDEAGDCLAANSTKYGRTAADLLAGHINRIYQFCQARGVTPVIYHDMLLGGDEAIYGGEGVANGTALKSYLARPLISHDIILDYWNYEAFSQYPTVQAFQAEGFHGIWMTPWGGAADYTMARNAYSLGAGVMGSTWTAVEYTDWFSTHGSKWPMIYTQRWLTDAVGTLAEAAWNTGTATALPYDPSVVVTGLYWDRGTYGEAGVCVPIWPAGSNDSGARALAQQAMGSVNLTSGTSWLKGTAFAIDPSHALALGNIYDLFPNDIAGMMAQPKPWTVYTDGRIDKQINRIDGPRGTNEVALYTRAFGRTTGTNGYGREVNVRCGQTHYGDDWGVGNMAIPRNGYVLSAHAAGTSGFAAMDGGYHTLLIKDAAGREVALGKRSAAGSASATISLNRKAKKLIFLQTTAFEAAHYMPVIATVEMTYADGSKNRFDLRYGRDICSYDDVCFLYGAKTKWLAASNPGTGVNDGRLIYAYEWANPKPNTTIVNAAITLSDTGRQIGYLLLGLTAVVQFPGDANGDGVVAFDDFSILQNNYGQSGKTWSQGDFNSDGIVSFEDFSILQNYYGQSGAVGNASAAGAGWPCLLPGLMVLGTAGSFFFGSGDREGRRQRRTHPLPREVSTKMRRLPLAGEGAKWHEDN